MNSNGIEFDPKRFEEATAEEQREMDWKYFCEYLEDHLAINFVYLLDLIKEVRKAHQDLLKIILNGKVIPSIRRNDWIQGFQMGSGT